MFDKKKWQFWHEIGQEDINVLGTFLRHEGAGKE